MEYTLDDLVVAVAGRLAAMGLDHQSNGQVRAFPDRRTLRYYTTLGLMDRPDTVRDRQAIYRDRHVTQAVAVKRLQASGWTLANIQTRLTGLDPAAIVAVAASPVPSLASTASPTPSPAHPAFTTPASARPAAESPAFPRPAPARTAPARPASATESPATPRRAEPFWATAPTGPDAAVSPDRGDGLHRFVAIPLADGVTLLLDGERAWAGSEVADVTGIHVAGIRAAASTLLNHLRGDAAHD